MKMVKRILSTLHKLGYPENRILVECPIRFGGKILARPDVCVVADDGLTPLMVIEFKKSMTVSDNSDYRMVREQLRPVLASCNCILALEDQRSVKLARVEDTAIHDLLWVDSMNEREMRLLLGAYWTQSHVAVSLTNWKKSEVLIKETEGLGLGLLLITLLVTFAAGMESIKIEFSWKLYAVGLLTIAIWAATKGVATKFKFQGVEFVAERSSKE